jgi:hypothetical protein
MSGQQHQQRAKSFATSVDEMPRGFCDEWVVTTHRLAQGDLSSRQPQVKLRA